MQHNAPYNRLSSHATTDRALHVDHCLNAIQDVTSFDHCTHSYHILVYACAASNPRFLFLILLRNPRFLFCTSSICWFLTVSRFMSKKQHEQRVQSSVVKG